MSFAVLSVGWYSLSVVYYLRRLLLCIGVFAVRCLLFAVGGVLFVHDLLWCVG